MIRPPDPLVRDVTLASAPYSSADAVRRLMHLVYRDCWEVLDVTFGRGGFWKPPRPPGILLTTSDLDAESRADRHLDFTTTGLDGKSYDLVVYDPPHLADGGVDGIMADQFSTAKGTLGLKSLVLAGFVEATRLARIGVLIKVTDAAHGSEWLPMSHWVTYIYTPYGVHDLYCVLHTYRKRNLRDPKWKVQRVPRSNGALYLCFRSGPKHLTFDDLYAKQEGAAR